MNRFSRPNRYRARDFFLRVRIEFEQPFGELPYFAKVFAQQSLGQDILRQFKWPQNRHGFSICFKTVC